MRFNSIVTAFLVSFTPLVAAGQTAGSSVKPTADVIQPRGFGGLGINRQGNGDSVKYGGPGHSLSNSSVAYDVCLIDANQAGCPNYCVANPSASICVDNSGGQAPGGNISGTRKILTKTFSHTETAKIPIGTIGAITWLLGLPVAGAPNLDDSKVRITVDSIRLASGCGPHPSIYPPLPIYYAPYPGYAGGWALNMDSPVSVLNGCVGRGNYSYEYTYTVNKIVPSTDGNGDWSFVEYVDDSFTYKVSVPVPDGYFHVPVAASCGVNYDMFALFNLNCMITGDGWACPIGAQVPNPC